MDGILRRCEGASVTVETRPERRGRTPLLALIPLVLLIGLVAVFVLTDPLGGLKRDIPPVETLTFDRVILHEQPHEIVVRVTNGGRDGVDIAQVFVDDAYWSYTIEPSHQIRRLRAATIHIPYPWVEGEAHQVGIISRSGIRFTHEIPVAVATPEVGGRTLGTFALIGIFVGVIPVVLGLAFFPFIRRLDRRWVNFLLALTAGLLVFLAVDALAEAFDVAGGVPGAFQGIGLITLGVVAALAALYGIDAWARQRRGDLSPLFVAGLIALGIGLHNLGEGLAIGAAYALGEVGLTTFLVVGFMLHNVTEGVGIVSPLARSHPTLRQLAGLGLLAGGPTIIGTWLGGVAYSPIAAVLFLSVGAGAIIQVVWEIGKLMHRETKTFADPLIAVGFAAGILVMYLTGLAVAA
jgi:zinc transporter, ZIP family